LAKVSLPIDPSLTHVTAYFERLAQHEIIGQK